MPSVTESVKLIAPKKVLEFAVTFMLLVWLLICTNRFCKTEWLKVRLWPLGSTLNCERLMMALWFCSNMSGPIELVNTGGSLKEMLKVKGVVVTEAPDVSVAVKVTWRMPVKLTAGVMRTELMLPILTETLNGEKAPSSENSSVKGSFSTSLKYKERLVSVAVVLRGIPRVNGESPDKTGASLTGWTVTTKSSVSVAPAVSWS